MSSALQRCLFDPTIQQQFEDFHRRHPEVYPELVKFALMAKRRGKKTGIREIWERMRWEFKMERDLEDEYKLNDHCTSRYARLIMEREPELAGFFELRRLRS